MKQPCVYILSNQARGTLYIGVTSDLMGRVWQHKQDLVDGFSKQYQLHRLVYYEVAETMLAAIAREKQLGIPVPAEFFSMLPYLATIIVLALISRNPRTILLNKPMSLGVSFRAAQ